MNARRPTALPLPRGLMHLRRGAAWLAGAALISGCAGNRPVQVTPEQGQGPALQIGYRVPAQRGAGYYALLEPTGSTWRVLRFGSELPPRTADSQEILFLSKDGRWVQPAYEHHGDGAYFSCGALSSPGKDANGRTQVYSPCGSSRFSTVNVGATALRTAIAVPLTLGLGVGTNRVVDTEQVQQALKDTGLLAERLRVAAAQERAARAIADFGQQGAQFATHARQAVKFDIKTTDRSGFFGASREDLSRLISVQTPDLAAQAKAQWARVPKLFDSPAAMVASHEEFVQSLAVRQAGLNDSYALELACNAKRSGVFAVALTCPPQVAWADIAQGRKVPVRTEILSVSPAPLLPAFALQDDTLAVSVGNGQVQMSNRSKAFVEIREISCYANAEITTRRWASNDQITLPPFGELKQPLRQDDLCRDAAARQLRLPPLKRDDIAGQSLRFGIAVKYRRAGENVDRTLFDQKPLALEALIRNAL